MFDVVTESVKDRVEVAFAIISILSPISLVTFNR